MGRDEALGIVSLCTGASLFSEDEKLTPGELVSRLDYPGPKAIGMVLERDEWGFYRVFWFLSQSSWGGYEGIGYDLARL